MDQFLKFLVVIHVIAGAVTLVSGPFAIFYNFKDVKNHRRAGKLFFYAMLVVIIASFASFFKDPTATFRQFLLGIALMVLGGVLRGVRFMQMMKGSRVLLFDWAYTLMSGLNGLWMCTMALKIFQSGEPVAFAILFGIFGAGSLADAGGNIRVFKNAASMERLDWMRLHVASMLGAFIASTTAFTVNSAPFLPWWAQWFGPTLLLVPVQIYFSRKLKSQQTVTGTNALDTQS